MLSKIKTKLLDIIDDALKESFPNQKTIPRATLENPTDKAFGEFTSNIALRTAGTLKMSPMNIAPKLVDAIEKKEEYSNLKCSVKVVAPGFINFYLSPETIQGILPDIFKENEKYGSSDFGQKERILIEFVSANPTGPLSVAHARQAVVGDVLVNILNTLGFKADKEYYINDRGNQIRILGKSFKLRMLELLGEKVKYPEECYQGEYIKDMARLMMEELKQLSPEVRDFDVKWSNSWDESTFENFAVSHILDIIKKDLLDFGVEFDSWIHESDVATKKDIEKTIELLRKKNFIKDEDGALWFKSTEFGDDKDRVLRKSDGSYTYLAPDIVYHKNKFERDYKRLFNIWGPDHHGYIPRIKAASQALGHNKDDIEVLIVQLATIYRQGEAVSMSTRKGQYISLREVMDEVGVDASRFFFLMRHISAHLDFDLELAKKETPENPVYYIQYAHARVNSINSKAKEAGLKIKRDKFSLLEEEEELDLIKKLGSFNDSLVYCYQQLDPYPLISFLQEVATHFHKFYDSHKVVGEDPKLSEERLGLINATRIVLANGLRLLGVSAPEQM